MINSNQVSNWATEVDLEEVYEDFNEEVNMLDSAYTAISSFCQKEAKKGKYKKLKGAFV